MTNRRIPRYLKLKAALVADCLNKSRLFLPSQCIQSRAMCDTYLVLRLGKIRCVHHLSFVVSLNTIQLVIAMAW